MTPATQHDIERLILETIKRATVKKSIKKLIDKLEAQLRKSFAKQGVAILKSFKRFEHSFKEAIDDTDITDLFDSSINDSANTKLSEVIQDTVSAGVTTGADWLTNEFGLTEYTFDLKNPRAIEYLKNYGADRVTQINDTSRERLRDIITTGLENGWSYNKIANQISAVFSDFSTKRAKLIAVTELGNAYQQGNLIVGLDLNDTGIAIEKYWLTMHDAAVSADCQLNEDDDWIPVDEAHQSGSMVPLEHPSCRCVELYRRVGSNVSGEEDLSNG